MQNIICFHNPDEINGYLSNWFLSDFTKNNTTFSSMEQYMMYQKAKLFQDNDIASKILQTSDAGKIKALGRSVKNYDDTIWNGTRQIIVYEGLLEKFRQNEQLRKKLIETGNAILAECAIQDKIWGIGLSMKNEKSFDMTQWKGQDRLGFSIIMERKALS